MTQDRITRPTLRSSRVSFVLRERRDITVGISGVPIDAVRLGVKLIVGTIKRERLKASAANRVQVVTSAASNSCVQVTGTGQTDHWEAFWWKGQSERKHPARPMARRGAMLLRTALATDVSGFADGVATTASAESASVGCRR